MRRKIGRLAGVVFLIFVLGISGGALYTQYIFQEAFHVSWARLLHPEFIWQKNKYPSLKPGFDIAEYLFWRTDPRNVFAPVSGRAAAARPADWPVFAIGPQTGPNPANDSPMHNRTVVNSATDVVTAIGNAEPGDVITIAPGTYTFSGKSIDVAANGTDTAPISVRAKAFGTVTLRFDLQEGFHVRGANWIFENLIIDGVCSSDSWCEHAFHVVGNAHSTVIRNNWISNFNASLKVNGASGRFPDGGTVAHNVFINDRPRQTSNPVTMLDIVAASNWVVEANFIADFAKAQGDRISYGAFFKGAGEDNIFERNLVRCEWRQRGGTRIGFSFGGGGTDRGSCRDGKCRDEHIRGIMRNNIVMNCPNDVGVYLNKSADTLIHNNLLTGTRGIDVRYPETTATILNNVIDGRILARTDGNYTERGNIVSNIDAALNRKVSSDVFAEPVEGNLAVTDEKALRSSGTPISNAARDFCGRDYATEHAQVGPFLLDDKQPCITAVP
tara:strand:- start:5888 stop:7384 length:1497 start_codon:yes stop_codon:yes gene_type:complete